MAAPTLPSSADRRRRRRLRLIPIVAYTIASFGLAYFLTERPSTTVIFVRHADTDVAMATDDPPLNARGRQRAELLADFMEDIDVVSGVNAIYAANLRRTQETAAPLGKRLNLPVQTADYSDLGDFKEHVLDEHHGEIVLVVAQADAIAPLIDEFHGSKRLPAFGPDDFNRVFIVTTPWYGKVKTLLVHYGEPPAVALEPPQSSDTASFSGGGQ